MVWDPASRRAVIIDAALDLEPQSGRRAMQMAEQPVEIVRVEGLTVDWLLETHAHANDVTALPYRKGVFNAPTAIGERINEVQERFAWLFNLGDDFPVDGSQFDYRFADGATSAVTELPVQVLHTPGAPHGVDITYVVSDTVFVGDTLSMADADAARCDLLAGSARELYRSIQRLFDALPDSHRLFVLHDYGTGDRPARPPSVSSVPAIFTWVGTPARRITSLRARPAMPRCPCPYLSRPPCRLIFAPA